VQQMIQAGVGAEVTIALGGKYDLPSIKRKGEPRRVTGRVKLISNGQFKNRGPMSKGVLMDMGPSVVLDTGRCEIVVISRHQEPNDLACFQSLGGRVRRGRRVHVGLCDAGFPEGAPAGLSAGPDQHAVGSHAAQSRAPPAVVSCYDGAIGGARRTQGR
jgi:hypothetical protein